MILLLFLIIGCLLLTWFLEEYPEEELEIRRLVKQSRENERRRMRHRSATYIKCGWRPTYEKRIRRYKPY